MRNSSSKEMAGSAKLKQLKSSWTPLSNEQQNQKIFEERRDLVNKWFDKWTDSQRKIILEDLISRCRVKQLVHADNVISRKKPVYHDDPTRIMPRALIVYLFSFLDPRTLCRCAQVSWNWRNIAELDQLWMPKSIRRGWILPFSPNPYEMGTWKRLYVENASNLKFFGKPKDFLKSPEVYEHESRRNSDKEMPESVRSELNKFRISDRARRGFSPRLPRPSSAKTPKAVPWKGSDPTPKDTWRNNYLENEDEVTKVKRLRKKGLYGPEAEAINQRAKNKVNTGTHIIKSPHSIPRSKSALSLREANASRPDWAKPSVEDSLDLAKASIDTSTITVSRPAPVVTLKPSKTVTISKAQPPSHEDEIFHDQPWHIPNDGNDSDT